jgi:integrase
MAKRVAPGVFERSLGHFYYVVTLPAGSAQKQEQVGGFSDAESATTARLAHQLRLREGLGASPTNDTVGGYCLEWVQGRDYRAGNTYLNYARAWRLDINPLIGSVKLKRLRPEDVERLYRQVAERAPSRLGTVRTVLYGALDRAVKYGHLARNPARLVRVPDVRQGDDQREVAYWSRDEARRFLEVCDGAGEWGLFFRVLLTTGMRRGEAVALLWSHFDAERGELRVWRTLGRDRDGHEVIQERAKRASSRRVIVLPAELIGRLIEVKRGARGVFMFSGARGGRLGSTAVQVWFARLCAEAGLGGLTVHGLRHTHAALSLEDGEPLEQLSRRLGHRNITTTMDEYGHLTSLMQTQAAERLGRLFG